MRVIVLAIGAALAAVVLSAGAPSAPGTSRCPSASHASSLPVWSKSPGLRGDVDGDGRLDRLSIRYAPGAHASCGFLLVAETHFGALATRVPVSDKPGSDPAIRDWPWPDPYLAAVVRLGARRSQVVVGRATGGVVVSVSLYGVVDGRLRVLRVGRNGNAGELSLFGTVGTGDTNARCLRGGPLIVLGEWPTSASGRRWGASRRVYRLAGASLRLVHARTVTGTMEDIYAQSQRWGMAALPFTGCTVVRGRRL